MKVYSFRFSFGSLALISLFSIIFLFSSLSGFTQEEGVLPSLKFKDADISVVLQAIAQKATKDGKHVNIIIAPEVEGPVTVDLKDVNWQTALDAVLKIYDYSYEWVGKDIVMVTTLERLAEKREKEALAAQQEPLETFTYRLIYLDAHDIETMIRPQLTPRGKITVLDIASQKGWRARGGFDTQSGAGQFERAQRETGARPRTKTLIITDTKSNIRTLLDAIKKIDIMPKQILIETRFMEVNKDVLRDIGLDYGTGATGDGSVQGFNSSDTKVGGGTISSDGVAPSIFNARSSINGSSPYGSGLEFVFRKLNGTEFQIALHALEEDVHTNTLSAPRVLTLDGQEAYIMVGEKRPIIESSISSSETTVAINKNLGYYQNLGIELNVVPQICGDNFVNMVIYPSVTSSSSDVTARSQIGDSYSDDDYPIITVRETQTQVLMKDGETISIGGLLKDVKSESVYKVPFLSSIPFFGKLFQRETNDTEKIDLIIFITVRIMDPAAELRKSLEEEAQAAEEAEIIIE
ncbi:MAG: hypothetical protein GY858_08415 [Candidatus Omnitrophica bacterium]|nr:hypothetical protein [Candidatus Omnitrophota bacterium]